ncbi:putative integrase/recombinase y4rB [Sphingomonas sp. T1]|uniref:tyrosine-type recombinase/integrase n=1 Tax=Sphingomonas sp. T1 TaxID=2653172 RepID=UPI0012F13773|nr:tyrosine-type recombinase/integrase [Sphingomonas sp. T1]VXD01292.1 putative integrase/recombinase y4rB [Sphingomonas sp. T1]
MNGAVTMLARAEAYLAERRLLGFTLDRSGNLTLAFARFADANGHEGAMTAAVVLRWAKEEARHADPFTWAGRVNVLRPFARVLAGREPGTAFPEDAPFGRSHRRLAPHVYTPAEIEALLAGATRLAPQGGLTPAMFTTLFGLLAATGLRISEALRLSCGDLDDRQEQLTVRHSKFQRTRLVPLHPTVGAALRSYLLVRAKYGAMDKRAPVFLSEGSGRALEYQRVRSVFVMLATDLGIVARGGHRSVRIHDLRHSFICRRLMLWQASGADIGNAMMALATYVGHINVGDTYWYMQAVPELMATAGNKFEAFGAGIGEAHHG